MFSSKKGPQNKKRDLQSTTNRNGLTKQEQDASQEEKTRLPDYGVHDSELIAAADPSISDPGHLDRLGLQYPYQGTYHPSQQPELYHPQNTFPTASQPAFQGAPAAYPGLQPGATPDHAAVPNWQHPSSSFYKYGSDSTQAVPVGSDNNFGYTSQNNTLNPYVGGYVSPTGFQNLPQPGYEAYPWPDPGDGSVSLGTSDPSTLSPPTFQNYGAHTGMPGEAYSDPDPAAYGEVEGSQQPHSTTQGLTPGKEPPRHKRAKKSVKEGSVSSPPPKAETPASKTSKPPSSSTTTTSKTKLRSASRASKNAHPRPEETPRERKSRNSHNQVEKQYRNRLNMQFETLMNALPESMRSPTGAGTGSDTSRTGLGAGEGTRAEAGKEEVGEGGSGSAALHQGAHDAGERRLSKAQVLDMSAQYIRSLEQERGRLEEEREELLEGMRRFREGWDGEEEEEE